MGRNLYLLTLTFKNGGETLHPHNCIEVIAKVLLNAVFNELTISQPKHDGFRCDGNVHKRFSLKGDWQRRNEKVKGSHFSVTALTHF